MTLAAHWQEQVRALADEAGLTTAPATLTAIAAHDERPVTRIAVCGESARLRHALVNELAGATVLAKSLDPPAEVPVRVVAATEDYVESVGDDGRRTRLAAGRWPERPRSVTVATAASRLRDLNAELISVGLVDLGDRTHPARLAVTGADAAIVVVSATAAMTLTETTFMEQLLAVACVPHVLVVVANLRLVEAEERGSLLAYLHKRAGAVSSAIVVVPGPPADGAEPAEVDVAGWVSALEVDRSRQLAGQLAVLLGEVADTATAAGRAAHAQSVRLDAERDAADRTIDGELDVFDGLRNEVQHLRNTAIDEFRTGSEINKRQLSTMLLQELQRTPDPRAWWTQDLPQRLEVALTDWAKRSQQVLRGRIEHDAGWLDGELVRVFELRVERDSGFTGPALNRPAQPAIELSDLRARKYLYRLGPAGLAVIAMITIPPIGPVAALSASVIGTMFAELRLHGLAEEQRADIRARLPKLVETVLDDYAVALTEQADLVYRHLRDEVARLRQVWRRRREEQLSPPAETAPGEGAWRRLADRAAALAVSITNAADNPPHEESER